MEERMEKQETEMDIESGNRHGKPKKTITRSVFCAYLWFMTRAICMHVCNSMW